MLSKQEFYHWFQSEVKSRWSRSQFSGAEMGDWYWRLKQYDIDTLTEAVRAYKVAEDPRRPSVKKVYERVRRNISEQRQRQATQCASGGMKTDTLSSLPEERLFIMCVEKDFDGCGPVGHYLPVLVWPFSKTYTAEQYQRNAEAFARKHADFYGGVWEVFTDTNQLDMMTRRRDLLGTKPYISKRKRSPDSHGGGKAFAETGPAPSLSRL